MPPAELLYNETHLWVSCEGDVALVGPTVHGLEQYGDVVAVELPEKETELVHGDELGELECTRGVWELYAPIDGVVMEVNDALVRHPELINDDPFGEGWLIRLKLRDRQQLDHLLTAGEYETLVEEEAELAEEEEEDEFNLLGE